ncbi:uncharacterized protein PAC_04782 [Phialocephala subalpina]|uniref:Heterokaryon incompatibility domain-containing protein n=1 Tax=Phialocephala subalpina TaxID=576137 RepID=A0A1L7WQ69_9HELO|nr:uncharacterized protein PAC_04782 [Phialocephala subalpina]
MYDFKYTPLKNPATDLRLVLIVPARKQDHLSCILNSIPDGHLQKYQALSYTWGEGTTKVQILLNGQRFMATPNLATALRSMRCETEAEDNKQLPFWIDAICINQEDSAERDEQVRRMKSIYQHAQQVVIWLGDYIEPSDQYYHLDLNKWKIDGIETTSEAVAHAALKLVTFLEQESIAQESPVVSIRLEDFHHSQNLQLWAQLSRLFHRPWFERLWVIQELAASRKAVLLWGKLQIPWSRLETAARLILRPGKASLPLQIRRILPLVGAHRITQVALQSMFNVDTSDILTVLHNTQQAKCSDPRDRLFAILGVVEDTNDVEIDYSIPVQQVYRNWAEKRIRRTGNLNILNACADSSRSGDLPSWVPDLRRRFGQDKPLWIFTQIGASEAWKHTDVLRMHVVEEGSLAPEKAAHGLDAVGVLHFSDDGQKLSVSARPIGFINVLTTIGDVETNLQDPTDLTARLYDIVRDWESTIRSAPGCLLDERGEVKHIREGLLRDLRPWVKDYEVLEERLGRWSWRCQFPPDPEAEDFKEQEAEMREFERNLFPRVHGCQMFIVDGHIDGNYGTVAGNCNAKIGDEVWRLGTSLTPFILRRVSELEHRLIGPCYMFFYTGASGGYGRQSRVTLI